MMPTKIPPVESSFALALALAHLAAAYNFTLLSPYAQQNYERHISEYFGVRSSGFSLLPARVEAIMRIAGIAAMPTALSKAVTYD